MRRPSSTRRCWRASAARAVPCSRILPLPQPDRNLSSPDSLARPPVEAMRRTARAAALTRSCHRRVAPPHARQKAHWPSVRPPGWHATQRPPNWTATHCSAKVAASTPTK